MSGGKQAKPQPKRARKPEKEAKQASTASTLARARTEENEQLCRAVFLATLRTSANVRRSADAAKINRTTAYNWRDADPAFAAAWDGAIEDAVDTLEQEAWRRAHDGVEKPIYQQKELVGHVQEYSDALMMFLLKAHRPVKFRETIRAEHTGENGGPIEVKPFSYGAAIAAIAPGPVGNRQPSGAVQGGGDGSEMGKDDDGG